MSSTKVKTKKAYLSALKKKETFSSSYIQIAQAIRIKGGIKNKAYGKVGNYYETPDGQIVRNRY